MAGAVPHQAAAQGTGTGDEAGIEAQGLMDEEVLVVFDHPSQNVLFDASDSTTGKAGYRAANKTNSAASFTIGCSNTNVIKIKSPTTVTLQKNDRIFGDVFYEVVGAGIADIIVTAGGQTYTHRIYSAPKHVDLISAVQSDYKSVTLKWKKTPGCSGYRIQRVRTSKEDEEKYETVATVNQANADSATVTAPWNVQYTYRVVGFVTDGVQSFENEYTYPKTLKATVKKISAEISSIKKSGGSLKLNWKKVSGAIGYKVYRGTSENGKYKCVYTAKSTEDTYTQKVKKGVTYYYKLRTVYPGMESDFSPAVSRMIPKSGKAAMVSNTKITGISPFAKGQYGWSWADSDRLYYYQANGKLHVVSVQGKDSLKIYELTSGMKVKRTKTIPLSFDCWGGFYQGPDGNFYVAVGYYNYKQSTKKTVIKVIQYNGRWKKRKTASIKGSASNAFAGIYIPFDAGNCRMDMRGNTLYLMTAREMFAGSDGVHHQSNISFKINTKTMKVSAANDSYVSHSFNQFVKFKDESLYVLDHGDAFPRSLQLLKADDYGTEYEDITTSSLFSFQGPTGENYTGCKVGGMEVGEKNVITCGISKPHKKKIKGVSGYDAKLAYNVYITVTNRKTGKTKLKWLTSYHPKTTSVVVEETRMVKLADDRFAILYTIRQNGKSKLKYVVVNDTGKKVYSKTYSGIKFDAASQPILYKGNIVWVTAEYESVAGG